MANSIDPVSATTQRLAHPEGPLLTRRRALLDTMTLIEDEPPSTLPRISSTRRPLRLGSGSDW